MGHGEVGGIGRRRPSSLHLGESKIVMREVTRALRWARRGRGLCSFFPGSPDRFQPVQGKRAAPAWPSPLALPPPFLPSAASGAVIDAVIGELSLRAN